MTLYDASGPGLKNLSPNSEEDDFGLSEIKIFTNNSGLEIALNDEEPYTMIIKRFSTLFVLSLVFISLMHGISEAQGQDEADWMPDANLRTAVRSALALDAGDTLTQADMENLTELAAKNSQISNITGLESATNLETLDLRDNTISNINAISGLTGLETLKLKGNTLSSITPLSGLTSLLLLNLRETGISSVSALSGLTNLEHLRLDGNSITDVQPLTSLVNLEKLWISGNSLTNAHLLSSLTNLTTIDITIPDAATWMPDANLRSVVRSALGLAANEAFSRDDLSTLTSLNAPQRQISNLTGLESATGLTTLVAWQNDVTSLAPIKDLTALTDIRIGNNDIRDIQPLAGLTALTKLGLQRNNISDVSALSGLVNLTWLRLAHNSVTDFSPLVTLVNVTDSDVDLPEPDTTAPSVRIDVPSDTQTGAFDATITFSEIVSGFVQSELSVSGDANTSITIWSPNADNTVFTAEITPTTSGTVTLDIAPDVATDAASNGNTAATQKTVTVTIADPTVTQQVNTTPVEPVVAQQQGTDTLAPDVGISVPEYPQNRAFDVTITFTEVVSYFVQADLSLGGSATASITDWSTPDNIVFTAEITPTTSGTVTLDIAPDVATDAASNGNTVALTQTVTVDLDAPSVILTLLPEAEDANHNRIDVEITFSEPVEGFESTDISITTNRLTQVDPGESEPPPVVAIAGWTPDSGGKTYTVYIRTYTKTDGQVIINVPADVATDIAGNLNIEGSELSIDESAGRYLFAIPVGPDGGSNEYSNSGCHLDFNIDKVREKYDINEDGSIDAEDVALVRDALGQLGDGILNTRTDINCDDIVDDKDLALVDDTESPTVRISTPTDTQSGTAFTVDFIFSEYVSGFDTTDVSFAGSTATATITRHSSIFYNKFTFKITPTTSGDLVISVPAGVVEDALGNLNTASTQHTVTIDLGIPSVSLSSTSPTAGSGVFTITITFSEAVTGFEKTDLSISSGVGASITGWETTDNTIFTATVTPTTSGWFNYGVPAGVATDTDGNSNTASNEYRGKIDLDPPTVTVSVPTDTQSGAFDVTIRFNESVYHFEQDDVSLADSTADTTITDWEMVSPHAYWIAGKGKIETRSVYEATITPTTSGTVVITIPADVATDTGKNGNVASDTYSITVNLALGGNAPSAILSQIMNLLDTTPLESLDLKQLEEQLDILRAQSDGSAEYLQAIAVLESVLAEMRPDKTQLLANYPNPFNPETWIPYHLANPSNVRITIYDTRGVVVRRLDLGHQREGYYTNRSRAAYWDGRNDFGEPVASGIYFYQFQADNMSLLRKMLILK